MTHILDEWADDFNRVMRDRAARLGKPVEPEPLREDTKAALAAVAPMIAAQALRHEADKAPGAWDVPVGVWYLDRTSRNYLRARAEQIEGGTTDADLEASLEWLESVAREREAGQ